MNESTIILTPLQRYQQDLQKEGFVADAAQARAVAKLDDLYHRLLDVPHHQVFSKLKRKWLDQYTGVIGLYLWGGVGRGKTYLMDIFFESLPIEEKRREHFHHFMQYVHESLIELKGKKDPLKSVARRIAKEVRVLCFDEFFVSDIADAMLLGGLLEYLFDQGVTLVATSNIVPDGLYRDGLQRERFLPAIEVLKQHVEVLEVDSGVDYRLRVLEKAEIYHFPLDDRADEILRHSFNALSQEHFTASKVLTIAGRKLETRYYAEGVVWFDFAQLCDGPRSQNDYIAIAHEHHTVLLSNVPCLAVDKDDQMRRFISLVDEFYDRNVKLIISAEVPPDQLYGSSGRLAFEFRRTLSRLIEMQSLEYLARAHKP